MKPIVLVVVALACNRIDIRTAAPSSIWVIKNVPPAPSKLHLIASDVDHSVEAHISWDTCVRDSSGMDHHCNPAIGT